MDSLSRLRNNLRIYGVTHGKLSLDFVLLWGMCFSTALPMASLNSIHISFPVLSSMLVCIWIDAANKSSEILSHLLPFYTKGSHAVSVYNVLVLNLTPQQGSHGLRYLV